MAALPISAPTAPEAELRSEITAVTVVTAVKIRDQASYDSAVALGKEVAAKRKRVVEFFGPMKDHAYQAHREICAREAEMLKPIASAEAHLKGEISRWTIEQERIRLETERKIREEQERLQAEQLEAQIEEAEAQGATVEEISAICSMPTPTPTPVVAPTFQRATGVSTTKRFRAEVFDVKALARAVADGRCSPTYIAPNLTALNARARADGETLQIPGVRVVVDTTVSVRTR